MINGYDPCNVKPSSSHQLSGAVVNKASVQKFKKQLLNYLNGENGFNLLL